MIFLVFITQICMAAIPFNYLYNSNLENSDNEGLLNNSIIDIEHLNSKIFLSTSSGLGFSEFDGLNFNFNHYDDESHQIGGKHSMFINNNVNDNVSIMKV